MYIKIDETSDIERVEGILVEQLDYTQEQSKQVVLYAKKHGKCQIFEGTRTEAAELTMELAKNYISAEMESKFSK